MYKLIIADDDIMMLELFKSAFDWESMGMEIAATFSSAAECLEYLKKNQIDAILTDIRMPHLSGLELAKICSELYPNIGIVITSAYTDFEYAHQAIKYNVIDYVLKPIDDDDFAKAMSRLKTFLDNSAPSSSVRSNTNPTINKILEYVNTHFSENISTLDVANHVMINPDYFSVYFKKHTGENFSYYLRRFRLKKACELLTETDLKISAVAEYVGYKNLTHFYERFYEQYNTTPAEYRKNN